jgi:hypothetical protein
MSLITPLKNRCERKLGEIQALKQNSQHSDEELEILGRESYYMEILNKEYSCNSGILLVHTEVVEPAIVEAHSIMSRCNHGKNVYKFIHTGNKYLIEMPEINTILNVTCTFAACRAADMHIDTATVNGQRDHGSETCTISYNYDNFDSIYYTSFAKPDACIIYSY